MTSHPETHELLERYFDGLTTADETRALLELIAVDPNLADKFRDLSELESMLQNVLEEASGARHVLALTPDAAPVAASATILPTAQIGGADSAPAIRWWRAWGWAASVALAATLSALWLARQPINVPIAQRPVETPMAATLVAADGCQWADGAGHRIGARLAPGGLSLETGLAKIELGCGTALVLEAPASIELLDDRRVKLLAGYLVVRTTGAADRFELQTDVATVHHLGTEFGVGATATGSIVIQVFEGAVTADWKGPLANAPQSRVAAGEALRLEAAEGAKPRSVMFRPERFVRTLPELSELAFSGTAPYNDSHIEEIHVRPLDHPLSIDGDLSDWDLSAQFTSRLRTPYGDNHYVAGAMMYDEQAIYLAAHVGDPFPLENVLDAELDPLLSWKGGSVQVRLAVDRDLEWPLVGVHPVDRGRLRGKLAAASPQDTSDSLLHVTMSYHRPSNVASLVVQFGLDVHGQSVNPPGYRGAMRRDDDGLGYTLEYAIPWSVLKATNPPRPGDTLATSWQIHWSDASGRLWRGHMVEVCQPGVKGINYRNAGMWGKAIYDPR